jgi:hypothetical protein
VTANSDWHTYRSGEEDKIGQKIDNVYALDADYVIYLSDCNLFYEITPELRKSLGSADLGSADAALARINWLLDKNQTKGSREYNFNFSTLELAGDAFEMFFRKETTEALEILKGIHDKLQAKEEGQRRLMYQLGALVIALLVWFFYLLFQREGWMPVGWNPWMLAAALAMAGGLFSVCLSVGSLEVNVNQQNGFLLAAGATRSVVALLAGIGMLLAMRSKMFAGITYKGDLPDPGDALKTVEMFFCFVAGFSEYFVPNILSKAAADKAAEAKKKQAEADKNKVVGAQ